MDANAAPPASSKDAIPGGEKNDRPQEARFVDHEPGTKEGTVATFVNSMNWIRKADRMTYLPFLLLHRRAEIFKDPPFFVRTALLFMRHTYLNEAFT